MKAFNIVETFYSIQGEGKYAGTAAYFIRFAGCNLKCDFGNGFVCDDTAHTNKALIESLSVDDLTHMALSSGTSHVVLTGGEVSMHNVIPLINALKFVGLFVQVETNGLNWANISTADFITYSPKMAFDPKAPKLVAGFHELKLLAGVNNPVDVAMWDTVRNKYVQPIGNEHSWDMDNVHYCEEFVKANPTWKLSLQTHKIYGAR